MDKQAKEKIRSLIGDGKLYEVEIYNGEAALFTDEKDFHFSSSLNYLTFIEDVTDVESSVIKNIKDFFGNVKIKILAYSDNYANIEDHKKDVLFKKNGTSVVADTTCYYIVSTPNKKGKIKKFNLPNKMFVDVF